MNTIINPVIYPYFIMLFQLEGKRFSTPAYTNQKWIKSFGKSWGKAIVTTIQDDYKGDARKVSMVFRYINNNNGIEMSSEVVSAN